MNSVFKQRDFFNFTPAIAGSRTGTLPVAEGTTRMRETIIDCSDRLLILATPCSWPRSTTDEAIHRTLKQMQGWPDKDIASELLSRMYPGLAGYQIRSIRFDFGGLKIMISHPRLSPVTDGDSVPRVAIGTPIPFESVAAAVAEAEAINFDDRRAILVVSAGDQALQTIWNAGGSKLQLELWLRAFLAARGFGLAQIQRICFRDVAEADATAGWEITFSHPQLPRVAPGTCLKRIAADSMLILE